MDGTEKEATEVVVVVAGTVSLAAAVERMEMKLIIEEKEVLLTGISCTEKEAGPRM